MYATARSIYLENVIEKHALVASCTPKKKGELKISRATCQTMIQALVLVLLVVTQVQSFYAPSLPYACAHSNNCKVVRRYQEPLDGEISKDLYQLVYGPNAQAAPPLIHALRGNYDPDFIPSWRYTLSDMINKIEKGIIGLGAVSKDDENSEILDLSRELAQELLESDYLIRMG